MPHRFPLLGALLLTAPQLVLAQPASAQLSSTEAKIVRGVEANHARTVELLAETVNINSGTLDAATIVGGTEASWDSRTARGSAVGKTNVVPPTTIITGDIRTVTDEQLESTRQRMRQIVTRPLPGTQSTITFSEGYPSMPPTQGNEELLETFSGVSQDLGMGPLEAFDPRARGAADVYFVAAYVDAAMDGLGPEGSGSHTMRETVNIPSIEPAAKTAAVLMCRLTR